MNIYVFDALFSTPDKIIDYNGPCTVRNVKYYMVNVKYYMVRIYKSSKVVIRNFKKSMLFFLIIKQCVLFYKSLSYDESCKNDY